ncbi:hypothetical protein TNCV_4445991 [Trichonephila clavipes]|nr:hypothetical protein TNCV_4445991 [Trichonephila clavipes]
MDWPALSSQSHRACGRRLEARTLPPVTVRELRLALQDELPQQLIDTLILSMGRRCETCLAYGGYDPRLVTEWVRLRIPKDMVSSSEKETCNGFPSRKESIGVVVLGFWTVRTVLNLISGQDFDAGHDESGVLHSARWHDGDGWSMESGRPGYGASSRWRIFKVV